MQSDGWETQDPLADNRWRGTGYNIEKGILEAVASSGNGEDVYLVIA